MFKINNDYEILTPSGFQDFHGIQQVKRNKLLVLNFGKNRLFKCSLDHPLIIDGFTIKAKNIKIGSTVGEFKLKSKNVLSGSFDLYDPINVANGYKYFSDFLISHNCQFLGSTNTLIDPDVLARLAPDSPIKSNESGLSVYKLPQPNRFYVMTVDVAKGLNKDYSAFIVFDITSFPYTIAATYYNNEIPPALFATPIYEVGRWFNLAHVLVERNDIGQEVTKILQQELEYENLLYTVKRPGKVVEIAYDDSGNAFKSVVGLDQNKTTKRIGCMALKALVESNKLIINDFELISELSKFSQKKQSWEAEEGHDDLVMCAANFGWLSTQRFLQDITNLEVRKALAEANARQLEDSIAPVGIRITGQEDLFIVDEKGVADATIPGIFKTFEQLLMD